MRLVDALLRQGHLSEQALVEAIMTGDRPIHLERCDVCADRAVEMNRWLDAVRSAAIEAADEAFPAERLAAQQAQIQRRIEQLDEPTRVIAFPVNPRIEMRGVGGRRVAPAWLGVAAAAGLVIGVIGGQVTARLDPPPVPVTVAPAAAPVQDADIVPTNASLFDMDADVFSSIPEPLLAMSDITPRATNVAGQ